MVPVILFFVPLPEAPIKAYPVYGDSSFDVLQHRVILSLGTAAEYDQSRYGMKRLFRVWIDVPNERWGKSAVTLECTKIQYRFNEGGWEDADRVPEADYRGGGSARIVFWSPRVHDLEEIDASRESFKMRAGRYDLRVSFSGEDGAEQVVSTTLTLGERTERHWTSIRETLEELSGIH
ncbi:hypothetical protein [Haloferula sp. A504]|uniref:hypothetical protein n=1 Tax=Haloferula sp. A504 TaxID=3373601 RepID=UPI0031C7DED7|nr:hypothetical protein [Verrucomicrobiaceae bacterium E54]